MKTFSEFNFGKIGMRAITLPVALFLVTSAQTSFAQECGDNYITSESDNLYSIAKAAYGDERKWSALYYANQNLLGHDPGNVAAGVGLRVPCLDTESAPDPTPFRRLNADLKLLTGGDYAPFTDQDLPGGGLLTELVNASFENSPSPVTFSLTWEDEWSLHLSPLIQNRVFDVGFPWFQPNCAENKEDFRCSTFHFSEPLFEMLIPLYVNVDNPIDFKSDADIEGKTLCRPAGYFTHDLDRGDRRWLTDNKINFVQAETIDDCFNKLVTQEVDAVTINEFTGRLKIQVLNLQDKVVAAERPLSIEGLHVLISKSHPRGTTFLYRFNAGLTELKKSKRYSEIIDRHLSNYWTQIESPTVTEASEDTMEEKTDSSKADDSTQSLEESETPASDASESNQQGEVEVDDVETDNTTAVESESDVATVSTDTATEPVAATVSTDTATEIASDTDDSQPPAVSEAEADVKNVSVQQDSPDETSSSMQEAASPTETSAIGDTSEQSAEVDETENSDEIRNENAEPENEEDNASVTELTADTDSRNDINAETTSAADTDESTVNNSTTDTDASTAIDNSESTPGNDVLNKDDGDNIVADDSETPRTTDLAAATQATDKNIESDALTLEAEEQSTDEQNTDESAIRKKRCKALPYFCRMFGLD